MIGRMDASLPPFVQHSVATRTLVLASIVGLTLIISGSMVLWSSSPSKVAPTPTPFAPKQTIMVDVQGAVEHPGLQTHERPFGVELRIGELLASAGGLRSTADQEYVSKHINLSSKVADGEKIYIPAVGDAPTETSNASTTSNGKLAINRASSAEILELKGIGETRAQTILSTRPFRSFEEFRTKTAFPASVLTALEPILTFD